MTEVANVLTADEAAQKLGYHLNHLYRLLAAGILRGEKWGGRVWMIQQSEVERVRALQDANGRLWKGRGER